MKVSVIVATYNSDLIKLKHTLCSIVCQKNIDFEVIVSDDGSGQDTVEGIKDLVRKMNSKNIRTNFNEKNKGTILNLVSAARMSCGEFIVTLGPGDLLFDQYVLSYLYEKASNVSNCSLFFGNAVLYSAVGENIKVSDEKYYRPARPYLYNKCTSLYQKKIAFFPDSIIGTTYFRKRELAIKYFEKASKIGTYLEDMISTALALADDNDIIFIDRNMVWYEVGTGITTSGDSKWHKVYNLEVDALMVFLKQYYPKDSALAEVVYAHSNGRFKRYLYRLIHYPDIFIIKICQKIKKKRRVTISDKDRCYLKQLLCE